MSAMATSTRAMSARFSAASFRVSMVLCMVRPYLRRLLAGNVAIEFSYVDSFVPRETCAW
jgi:hypothetical protein